MFVLFATSLQGLIVRFFLVLGNIPLLWMYHAVFVHSFKDVLDAFRFWQQ